MKGATNDGNADALLARFGHAHNHGVAPTSHEKRTRWVVALTFAMMVAELAVGYATNSLALTADGWHMATHAGALGMASFAYWFARKKADSSAFSFGTGKVHALAGYTSAVVLAIVALLMVVESVRRLLHPEAIAFAEALPVAVLGLLVNLASVKLLHANEHHHSEHHHAHDHDHNHGDPHDHDHPSQDHNLRAAYFHVLADALTSVLAIFALLGGRYLSWTFLDPAMGIVGGVVIARWSHGLCRDAARQLLDVVPSRQLVQRIRTELENTVADTRIVDFHLWDIGPRARACILSVVAPSPRPASAYREALARIAHLEHVTIEVQALAPEAHAEEHDRPRVSTDHVGHGHPA